MVGEAVVLGDNVGAVLVGSLVGVADGGTLGVRVGDADVGILVVGCAVGVTHDNSTSYKTPKLPLPIPICIVILNNPPFPTDVDN